MNRPVNDALIRANLLDEKTKGVPILTKFCELNILKNADLSQTFVLLLTKWRDKNQKPFMKLFEVTAEGTGRWASHLVKSEDRILFIIKHNGVPVGHIGYGDFGRGFEFCDVLRGEKIPPEVMHSALDAVIQWGLRIGMPSVFLRVAADANRALGLYHRAGFEPTGLQPLRKRSDGTIVSWVESNDPREGWDRFYVDMVYRPELPMI